MSLVPLLKEDNLSPLLYSCVHHGQNYFYVTYSKTILIDFEIHADMAYMLTVLLAIFYVFDVKFPRYDKPILEILDYFVFHGSDSNIEVKNSFAQKLTMVAQNIISEYEKKLFM